MVCVEGDFYFLYGLEGFIEGGFEAMFDGVDVVEFDEDPVAGLDGKVLWVEDRGFPEVWLNLMGGGEVFVDLGEESWRGVVEADGG